MESKKYTITSRKFDLGCGETGRIFKLYLLDKVVPLGNLSGGPGLKSLIVFFLLHRIGQPIFRLLIPYEDRLTSLYRRIKKPVSDKDV